MPRVTPFVSQIADKHFRPAPENPIISQISRTISRDYHSKKGFILDCYGLSLISATSRGNRGQSDDVTGDAISNPNRI